MILNKIKNNNSQQTAIFVLRREYLFTNTDTYFSDVTKYTDCHWLCRSL